MGFNSLWLITLRSFAEEISLTSGLNLVICEPIPSPRRLYEYNHMGLTVQQWTTLFSAEIIWWVEFVDCSSSYPCFTDTSYFGEIWGWILFQGTSKSLLKFLNVPFQSPPSLILLQRTTPSSLLLIFPFSWLQRFELKFLRKPRNYFCLFCIVSAFYKVSMLISSVKFSCALQSFRSLCCNC